MDREAIVAWHDSFLVRSLREDAAAASRDLLINKLGGAFWMPRIGRFALYRLAGLRIRTPDIYCGCTFVGTEPLEIGPLTFVNRNCYFESIAPITIGASSAIGMEVLIITSTHEFDAAGRFSETASGGPVRIGDRCWIGARAMILPGVTVGDDVVVAAGAVVTKDLPSGGLYAGVPARFIRAAPDGPRPPEIPPPATVPAS